MKLNQWMATHSNVLIGSTLSLLAGLIIGGIIEDHLMAPQAHAETFLSPIERNFGNCQQSQDALTLTLTVTGENFQTAPQALVCAGGGPNQAMYSTAEGVLFDAPESLGIFKGDVVKVQGRYYIADGKRVAISATSVIFQSQVPRPPIYSVTATPQPLQIVPMTPTPLSRGSY